MLTRKNPNANESIKTIASTKNNESPEIKELVDGYFFVIYVLKSPFVITNILPQKLLIV